MIKKDKNQNQENAIDEINFDDLIRCLKKCNEYIISLYKQIYLTPKVADPPNDLNGYCRNLQKMLKKFIDLFPKYSVPIVTHNKVKKEYDNIEVQMKKMLRENKNYACEINVLEKRLQQSEKREQLLVQANKKGSKVTEQFESKVEKIRKESEESINKVIENSRQIKSKLGGRKQSLPFIQSINQERTASSGWIFDFPAKGMKTQRLVQHLYLKN